MKRVACPHCGFQNFEISAYCGRCERPLPSRKKKTEAAPATPAPAPAEKQPPPPLPQKSTRSEAAKLSVPRVPPPVPPREDLSPMPIETTELMRAQEEAVYRRAEVRAATENLPEAMAADAELDAIEAIEAAGALDLEDAHAVEVPVQLASGLQIAAARLIDVALLLAVGAGVAWLETLLFATPWHTRSSFVLDVVADWVHSHPGATAHGIIATVIAGIVYNLVAGRRGGRTLGRLLTGTVLVRASGRGLTWPFLTLRLGLSVLSLALLGAGYFWSLIDNQHRTWHDIIVGTIVVRRRVRLTRQ